MSNDYYITHSGKQISIENFNEDMVCLEDIAHHLTKEQRYGGSLPLDIHYSVAEHCLKMVIYASTNRGYKFHWLAAILLHDASEAYLRDIPSPLKVHLPDYQRLERKVMEVIYRKYIIDTNLLDSPELKDLDKRMMLAEVDELFPEKYRHHFVMRGYMSPLNLNPAPLYKINNVYETFLEWCDYLGIKDL